MNRRARDLMHAEVRSVSPEMTLPELERQFFREGVTGFPVVDEGRLLGIVSRSDIVRQLCVEQSLAETASDYYREVGGIETSGVESLEAIGQRVGARVEKLCVRDVMIDATITATPDQPLRDVARTLVTHHIHRLPVVEGGKLVGIITSLDLVRLFAEDRVSA
ncbi:MAG: CBS domain-containing protein [Deltaproteobacteria bacterium]|nr:MAG: CBS domain-containing protein [Deltaproteobacteria bacterium]